jgi:energy-coupling factor transport system permease protein
MSSDTSRIERQPAGFVENLHPAVKLAGVAALSAASFGARRPESLALLGGLAIFVALLAEKFEGLMDAFRRVFWFVVVIMGVAAFSASGEIVAGVNGFYVTREGLLNGLLLSGRLLAATWWATLLVLTTSPANMVDGIEWLMRPLGRLGAKAALFLRLTISFVPVMIRSATAVTMAREARGFAREPGFFGGIRNAGAAATPVVATAVRAAGYLADAVDMRGFDPGKNRTLFCKSRIQRRDAFALCLLAAAAATGILL